MDTFQGELERKMELFELNLRTLSEAKRKYSAEGLFGWISSPRSIAEEDFDPLSGRTVEGYQEQELQEKDSPRHEEREESITADNYGDVEYSTTLDENHVEEHEDDVAPESDIISASESSMLTTQPSVEVPLPKPSTKTEVAIHDILTGMMDTVKHLAVSNNKMKSEHQENEARRIDRKLRRRQSSVLTREPAPEVDADVDTAMGECASSSVQRATPSLTPLFDGEFPRVLADSSLTRKPARTDTLHEPADGPNRTKRKRTLGPFTQVKGRRASDDAIGRRRRLHKRRPAAHAAESSPETSPRAIVELFLNPWAAGGGGGSGGGAHSSASEEHVMPTPAPRQRMSWRDDPTPGGVANEGEQSPTKEQPSPREVSPRVPIHRRPKPTPPLTLTPAVEAPPVRKRISWRSDAAPGPKATAASTSLIDAPAGAAVDADAPALEAPRKPRLPRRKAAKHAPVAEKEEEVVEQVVDLQPAEDERPPATASTTTAPAQRGRGDRTRERQQRWQRRQDELAARAQADEVAARVRAQRQWLRAQEELGGEEAVLTRCYELPTVSSVMKRVVKSYMPSVGLAGIPFVVGTSTSPTHHCGLKLQAELRKFKLKLPNKLGHNSSAMTTCTESDYTGTRCPAASLTRCSGGKAAKRSEDRWADACAEPSCTCCVRKTEPAEKVLQEYVGRGEQVSVSPSRNRVAGSRLDLNAARAVTPSAAALTVAAAMGNQASVLSRTDLHGESLQTLKVKIGGLKECLVRLQDRFSRLHTMRNDATLDLTEKQITELDRKIENKEQEINVVLALMREIFTLSRSQKASVVSVAESTRSRRSRGTIKSARRRT